MLRRLFALLTRATLFAVLFVAGASCAQALEKPQQPITADGAPNFLFIAIDDLNDYTGFAANEPGNFLQVIYPDPEVRARVIQRLTPNLDRLAKQSSPFLRSYCPSPLCGPSRTSLLTGTLPHESGYLGHRTHFRTNPNLADAITLPQHLKANGYSTFGLGKIFHGWQGRPNGPVENDWADAKNSWTKWINHPIGCGQGSPAKYSPPDGGLLKFGPSRLELEEANDWLAADFTARLLEEGQATTNFRTNNRARQNRELELPDDKPFFLACGFSRPHLPFYAPQEFFDRFPTNEMTGLNPESLQAIISDINDVPEGGKPFTDFDSGKMRVLIDNAVKVGGDNDDAKVAAWREIVQSYLACVSFADACAGRLLSGLENSAYKDNTVVVLWSDHGYHLGSKYHIAKQALWEEANLTTLLIRDPRNASSCDGKPRRQIVSLRDLYPTICSLANVNPPDDIHGVDLSPLLNSADAAEVNSHVLMTYQEGNHSLRTPSFRLSRYADGSTEFFDHSKDPQERDNLVARFDADELSKQEWFGEYERLLATLVSETNPSAEKTSSESTRRPNVLFIAMDDLNDWIGCMGGHPQSLTPNLDRLASQGVLFTNAHCPAPACNPSRSAIFTGRAPNRSGLYDNRQQMRELMPAELIMPAYFREHGYEAIGSGKLLHYFIDAPSWDEYFPAAKTENPLPPTYYPETRPVNLPVGGPWQYVETDWAALDVTDEEFGGDYSVSGWVGAQLTKEHDQPFFLGCGIYRPHEPWFVPKKYYEPFPLEDIQLPPGYLANDLDDVPAMGQSAARNRYFAHIQANGMWKSGIQGYLASIHFGDAMLGRVMKALNEGPNADNTIVVLWSDHGWQLGEKEHWQKYTPWRGVTRVPLIVYVPPSIATSLPTGTKAGSVCEQPVNLLSLFPTLTELCDVPPNPVCDGPSLLPLLKDSEANWDHVSTTYLSRPGSYSVNGNRFHYIHYADGSEELYDFKQDRYEWKNLASDPEYSQELKDLRRASPTEFAERVEPSIESLSKLAWMKLENESPPVSNPDGGTFPVFFENRTDKTVNLFWIDREGAPKPYGEIAPGQRKRQSTRPGAVWMIRDSETMNDLGYFRVLDRTARAIIPAKD